MIKTPTVNQFAFGAMLLGFLLVGIVLGAWLGGHDKTREWISALSGWAAALAAAVTVVYLRETLETARSQANHAARQTAILNGEIDPILSYSRPITDGGSTKHLFEIFNDSKYSMRVLEISIREPKTVRFTILGDPNKIGVHRPGGWMPTPVESVQRVTTNFPISGASDVEIRPRKRLQFAFFEGKDSYIGVVSLRLIYVLDRYGINDRRKLDCEVSLELP